MFHMISWNGNSTQPKAAYNFFLYRELYDLYLFPSFLQYTLLSTLKILGTVDTKIKYVIIPVLKIHTVKQWKVFIL